MSIEFAQPNGYRPDFVARRAAHLAYLQGALAPDNRFLDGSLASLRRLDERLTLLKQASPGLPEALVLGTVAYCGEVLRVHTAGQWFFYVCPADEYGGERYFPAIQRADGTPMEFVGRVEEEFERPTGFRLYAQLTDLMRPDIPTQTWERHPAGDAFPPLTAPLVLKKVFPVQ